MGGLCYLLDDKMLAGIVKDQVMARINPDFYSEALEKEGCNEMNFTGRALKGFVFIDEVPLSQKKTSVFGLINVLNSILSRSRVRRSS